MITSREISDAFEFTSFGDRDHRKLLEQGVLKNIAQYRSGSTLTAIMKQLGLLTDKGRVSKKGRRFVFEAFKDNANTG